MNLSRRSMAWLGAAVLAVAPVAFVFAADGDQAETAGHKLGVEANKWVASLDDAEKKKGLLSFDDPVRFNWHYIPKNDRKGVQLGDMTDAQQAAAIDLLHAALSETGFKKARNAMALDGVLKKLEKGSDNIRESHRYYFTLFGTPADTGDWGLSVEGHHLSTNVTIHDGKIVSVTPSFIGANPAIVKDNGGVEGAPPVGSSALAEDDTVAIELLASLTPEQRKAAILAPKSPLDMSEGGKAQTSTEARGIAASELNDTQKRLLRKLVTVYVNNTPAEAAGPYMAAVDMAGIDKLHFAWWGGEEIGVPHSYRVQGPDVAIVFFNTQGDVSGNPANHIHGLWRTVGHDFGTH